MANPSPKILVVDDDSNLAEVLSKLLQRKGFTVRIAYGGFEAIKATKEFLPDIILSDIKMAEGSGLDLLDFIKSSSSNPPPFIALMTGFTETSEKELLERGAEKVFYKPVRINEVESMVLQLTNTSERT